MLLTEQSKLANINATGYTRNDSSLRPALKEPFNIVRLKTMDTAIKSTRTVIKIRVS